MGEEKRGEVNLPTNEHNWRKTKFFPNRSSLSTSDREGKIVASFLGSHQVLSTSGSPRSGSCSSLPEWAECGKSSQDDTERSSAEPLESSELCSSLTSSLTLDSEEEERSEGGNGQQQGRQQAWLRTIRAPRSSYASDPECGRAVERKTEDWRRR